MRGACRVAEDLLAFQEGHCFMGLVNSLVLSGCDFSHWLLSLSGFQVLLCLPGGFA